MKLNVKSTIKVSFAFAIIMVFWTTYDFVVPLLLDNIYGLPDDIRGLVMGLDNLLSLFLLPLFGNLSDKTKTKIGKRTPYIILGTIISVVLLIFVPITANKQLGTANEVRARVEQNVDSTLLATFYDDAAVGKNTKYCDIDYLKASKISREEYINLQNFNISVDGKGDEAVYKLDDTQISKVEYDGYKAENAKFKLYVQSGLNVYVSNTIYEEVTLNNIGNLILYMILLFFVLVAMATFRSPAIALMPDVTPKPLRSQANAIISLGGGVGGAIAFLIYTIWLAINQYAYIQIFATVGISMLALLALFLKLVKEPRLVDECHETCKKYNISDQNDPEYMSSGGKMSKPKLISFLLILSSIFMWFMGYNAVMSNLSIYCTRDLLFSPSVAGIISAVSLGVSAIAFIPVGWLAGKFGRKKIVIAGYFFAIVAYILTFLLVKQDWTKYLFPVFYIISGFGLIITNVNTLPMVVELSSDSDVGKFTGYYYTATMSAQAITPYIAGLFMKINPQLLFLYSAVCIVVAVVLMYFVKHGNAKKVVDLPTIEGVSNQQQITNE